VPALGAAAGIQHLHIVVFGADVDHPSLLKKAENPHQIALARENLSMNEEF